MGLGDIANTVLTRYKADTTDARKELRKLRGAERKAHKERLDELEAHNGRLDDQIAMWGKVAAGVAAAGAAAAVAWKGIKTLQENSRRAAATIGADLNGLRDATNGLVKDTELLDFASKAMNGTFKLSNAQMQDAVKGALALRKTLGVDLEKALEVTQKAITEGTVEPLKELGIVVKDVTNDTEEGLNAALAALREQAREAGPDLALPGDEISKSAVKMENSMNKLMEALGRLAIKMAPVIEGFAKLVGFVAALPDLADSAMFAFEANSLQEQVAQKEAVLAGLRKRNTGWTKGSLDAEIAQLEKELAIQRFQLNKDRGAAAGDLIKRATQGAMGSVNSAVGGLFDVGGAPAIASGRSRSGRGRGGGAAPVDPLDALMLQAIRESGLSDYASQAAGFRPIGDYSGSGTGMASPEIASIQEAFAQMRVDIEAMRGAEQQSVLEGLFGPLSQFNAYAEGFNILTGAATAAFDAWITGAEGIGTAFKRAIGESLRSLASQMLIESIKHGAYALGSLAFGDFRGAATHGAAALKFGAGAAAAGLAAKQLGAGGGAPGPSATAGTAGIGASSGGAGGAGGPNTRVFILGDNFGGMSSRERESRFREMSRAAGVSIEGDVILEG